jgi:hypothetical protein
VSDHIPGAFDVRHAARYHVAAVDGGGLGVLGERFAVGRRDACWR